MLQQVMGSQLGNRTAMLWLLLLVGRLLNVPATCQCISGTGLLRQMLCANTPRQSCLLDGFGFGPLGLLIFYYPIFVSGFVVY